MSGRRRRGHRKEIVVLFGEKVLVFDKGSESNWLAGQVVDHFVKEEGLDAKDEYVLYDDGKKVILDRECYMSSKFESLNLRKRHDLSVDVKTVREKKKTLTKGPAVVVKGVDDETKSAVSSSSKRRSSRGSTTSKPEVEGLKRSTSSIAVDDDFEDAKPSSVVADLNDIVWTGKPFAVSADFPMLRTAPANSPQHNELLKRIDYVKKIPVLTIRGKTTIDDIAHRPVMIFAHNSTEDLLGTIPAMERFAAQRKVDIVAFEYRGYGVYRWTGRGKGKAASYSGLMADFCTVYKHVLQKWNGPVVLCGRGLGATIVLNIVMGLFLTYGEVTSLAMRQARDRICGVVCEEITRFPPSFRGGLNLWGKDIKFPMILSCHIASALEERKELLNAMLAVQGGDFPNIFVSIGRPLFSIPLPDVGDTDTFLEDNLTPRSRGGAIKSSAPSDLISIVNKIMKVCAETLSTLAEPKAIETVECTLSSSEPRTELVNSPEYFAEWCSKRGVDALMHSIFTTNNVTTLMKFSLVKKEAALLSVAPLFRKIQGEAKRVVLFACNDWETIKNSYRRRYRTHAPQFRSRSVNVPLTAGTWREHAKKAEPEPKKVASAGMGRSRSSSLAMELPPLPIAASKSAEPKTKPRAGSVFGLVGGKLVMLGGGTRSRSGSNADPSPLGRQQRASSVYDMTPLNTEKKKK